MKNIKSYKSFTDSQAQNYLAQSFPKGKLFANIFDSAKNIYKYVLSLSVWLKIVTGQLFILAKNRDITKVDELLTEYETSVKLPERYAILDTLEKRRLAVNRLISKIPVINIGDINDITNIENYIKTMTDLEVEIEINDTMSTISFPIPFPIIFDVPYLKRRLILIIKYSGINANNFFPLPFPVIFYNNISDTTKNIIDNALNDVVPSYQIWEYEVI